MLSSSPGSSKSSATTLSCADPTGLLTYVSDALARLRRRPGVLLIRLDGDADAQARLLMELRQRIPVGRGSAVVLRGSRELKTRVDVWEPSGDGIDLMRAVKQRLAPRAPQSQSRAGGTLDRYAASYENSVRVRRALQAAVFSPTARRSASRSVTTRW